MKPLSRYKLYSCLLGAFLLAPMPAHACSCKAQTSMESKFSRAKAVFIAEITDTKLVKTIHKEHDLEYIFADIDIIESFKDSTNKHQKIKHIIDLVPEDGNCSIGLVSGMEYVFFVDDHHAKDEEDELGWIEEDNYVGRCTGSHEINIYSVNFEKEHEKLQTLATRHKDGTLPDLSHIEDKDVEEEETPLSFKLND